MFTIGLRVTFAVIQEFCLCMHDVRCGFVESVLV